MCDQGIEWDLLYVLQMSKLKTFEELATKVHNMEMTIANRRMKASATTEAREEKGDLNRNFKSFESTTKESMTVTTS